MNNLASPPVIPSEARYGGDTFTRAPATRPLTVVYNDVITDTSIKFCDLGLYVAMLAEDEGTHPTVKLYAGQGEREGRDAVRKSMDRLIKAGYVTCRKWQDAKGFHHQELTAHDTRQTDVSAGQTAPWKSADGFPVAGFPGPGNPEATEPDTTDVPAGQTAPWKSADGFPGRKDQSQIQDQSQNHHHDPEPDTYSEQASPVPDDDLTSRIRKKVKIRHNLDITAVEAQQLATAFLARIGLPPGTSKPWRWYETCIENERHVRTLLPDRPAARRTPRGTCGECDPSTALLLAGDRAGLPCPKCRADSYARASRGREMIEATGRGMRLPE